MCIAIAKPEGRVLTQQTLENCFSANPDGAGFMYAENGRLHIEKGFFTLKDFLEAYEPHKEKTAVIHFRIRTHGPTNAENCHPFQVSRKLGVVHNGTITGYNDNNKSDTWLFNEEILQPLVRRWGALPLFSDPIKSLIEDRIGWSKLVFLDNQGNIQIMNEKSGTWESGVWFSNYSFRTLPRQNIPDIYRGSQSQSQNKGTVHQGKGSSAWKYKEDNLEAGALIYLTDSIYDDTLKVTYKKYTLWEVVNVNADYTVDVIDEDSNTLFLYNVPFWKLELFNEQLDCLSERNTVIPNGNMIGGGYDYYS